MEEIARAVWDLMDRGVKVLSPADPRVVDQVGAFLFVASDRYRSVRLVQDRHLESITSSDLLWLVSPDGYVGQSAAMEMGFAAAKGIPVYGQTAPTDLTLRQYVTVVSSLEEGIRHLAQRQLRSTPSLRFLIDPRATIDQAHATLEHLKALSDTSRGASDPRAHQRLYETCEDISKAFKIAVQ